MGIKHLNHANSITGLVAEYTVTGSAVSEIPFSNLNILQDRVYRFYIKASNATASDVAIHLFLNGDTTATNYYTQLFYSTGATAAGVNSNDAAIAYLIASDRVFAEGVVGLVGGKAKACVQGHRGSGANLYVRNYNYETTSTSLTDVTSMLFKISTGTNAFAVGSYIAIYKGL